MDNRRLPVWGVAAPVLTSLLLADAQKDAPVVRNQSRWKGPHTVTTNGVVVFFSERAMFSNFFNSPICDSDGIIYKTMEHFCAHRKAVHFGTGLWQHES
jgi:hypothetical protein